MKMSPVHDCYMYEMMRQERIQVFIDCLKLNALCVRLARDGMEQTTVC